MFSLVRVEFNKADFETICKLFQTAIDVYTNKHQAIKDLYRNAIDKQDFVHAQQLSEELNNAEIEEMEARHYLRLFKQEI